MPKVRSLTPAQARRTICQRLGKRVDRVRQIATNLGARPYRVSLVWVKWTGTERGEGSEVEVKRVEILPTPLVESMDAVSLSPLSAGTLPIGTIRVSEISVDQFNFDILSGRIVPTADEDHVPEPYDFFYEVREDGRHEDPPLRAKYRLSAQPLLVADEVQWRVLLERVSEDPHRDGTSRYGEGS